MINIRLSTPADAARINAFLSSRSPNVRASEETIFIAEEGEAVIEFVRLVTEGGHLVLRSMYVHDDHQRKGIGRQMLRTLEDHIRTRDCYCLPFTHLVDFYGTIGFVPIKIDEAPPHLQERLRV
jgi:GNAT superfamily N-acetyltransferase